jgi:hypothetical protein
MTRYATGLIVLMVTFVGAPKYGTNPAIDECPRLTVSCPDVSNTSSISFLAAFTARPDDEHSLKWSVSKGRIVKQLPYSIEVDVSGYKGFVTATAEITGFPKPCPSRATCSVRFVPAGYPLHWWIWVFDPNKPAWEILPQEAGRREVILSKRNELGLLSNFAPTPFVFHSKHYASLEGFWQSMLYPEGPKDPRAKFPGLEWKYTRDQVAAMTAFEAKHAGDLAEANMRKMGIGWVSFEGKRFAYRPATPGRHYRLIVAATWAKVNQNPEVKKVLLATGDLILKPDHHQEPNAPAAWRYFEIWMKIRKEIDSLTH